jgi:hypothetical protein
VLPRGARRAPRSSMLTACTLSPDRSASCSCVRFLVERRRCSRTPKTSSPRLFTPLETPNLARPTLGHQPGNHPGWHCEGPGGRSQTPVVGGLPGPVGEEVAEPAAREPEPTALGVAAEQNLSDGQADQLRVGEARRPAGTLPDAELDEEVVDLDVECRDEGVEFGVHKPVLGALALLVTACFLIVGNPASIV